MQNIRLVVLDLTLVRKIEGNNTYSLVILTRVIDCTIGIAMHC
jgi:hypothetical protein